MADDCACKNEGRFVVLEQQDQSIKESLNKFETKLDLILLQTSKVAVLETNHANQNEAIGRAFKRIEGIEGNVEAIMEFVNKTKGMATLAYVLWGACGTAVVMLTIKILFFMGANGASS